MPRRPPLQLAARIEGVLEVAPVPAVREFASGAVDRALRRRQIGIEELLEDLDGRRPAGAR
jgi:hypothetical protein